jgi:DNA-binding NarL/FixJ family response regulator
MLVLVITGYPEEGRLEQVMACGADAYLLKPFTMEALHHKVEALFASVGGRTYHRAM